MRLVYRRACVCVGRMSSLLYVLVSFVHTNVDRLANFDFHLISLLHFILYNFNTQTHTHTHKFIFFACANFVAKQPRKKSPPIETHWTKQTTTLVACLGHAIHTNPYICMLRTYIVCRQPHITDTYKHLTIHFKREEQKEKNAFFAFEQVIDT